MTCRDCQEWLATSARDGTTIGTLAEHLSRCTRCWEFADQVERVSSTLSRWELPAIPVPAVDAACAALVSRLVSAQHPRERQSRSFPQSPLGRPLLLLVGAMALASVAEAVPPWAWHLAAAWALLSAVFGALILLLSCRRFEAEGEWE